MDKNDIDTIFETNAEEEDISIRHKLLKEESKQFSMKSIPAISNHATVKSSITFANQK